MGLFDKVWEKEEWDRPGYNPKNGKIRALFRWEGCKPFRGVVHPETGEYVPGVKFFGTRPHARAFHFAWWNFFICFIMWFAISPLMPTLKKPKCLAADSDVCKACALTFAKDNMKFWGDDEKDPAAPKGAKDAKCKVCYPYEGRAKARAGCGGLGLTDQEVKISTLIGISGTFIVRVILGPLAEGVGVRVCMAGLLCSCAIPGFAMAGTVDSIGIYICRFFVGWAGGTFVLTSMWATTFFDVNVIGIANATAAGWGNFGGGIALLVNAAVFKGFKTDGYDNNTAWRGTLLWSPAALFLSGILTYLFTDDCPYGNFYELKKRRAARSKEEMALVEVGNVDSGNFADPTGAGRSVGSIASSSLQGACLDWRTWILFVSYGASFGVELVVCGNVVDYFTLTFGMSQYVAATAGAGLGLTNIFARAYGGWMSDLFAERWGVTARIWAFFIQHAAMSALLIIFTTLSVDNSSFGGMMVLYIIWAIAISATNGGNFAMLPYVNPTCVGGVAGIVGAGGNFGAMLGNVLIGFVFVSTSTVKPTRNLSFLALGWYGIAVTLLLPLLWLPGQGSMFRSFKKAAAGDEPGQQSEVAYTYNEVPRAPSQMQGPMPTFVYPQMQQQQIVQMPQQMPVYRPKGFFGWKGLRGKDWFSLFGRDVEIKTGSVYSVEM